MSDLRDRLKELDEIGSPDLWPAISMRVPGPETSPPSSPRRRVVVIALALILVALGVGLPLRALWPLGDRHTSAETPAGLFFPTAPANGADALMHGVLEDRNGCLVVGKTLVIWPTGSSPTVGPGGVVEVLNAAGGQVVARVGSELSVGGYGGGGRGATSGAERAVGESIPSACATGFYWYSGVLDPLPSPTIGGNDSPTARQFSNPYLGISLTTPGPTWKVRWTGVPWRQAHQDLAEITSAAFGGVRACPNLPNGQVAVQVSDSTLHIPASPVPSDFPPKPSAITLPPPGTSPETPCKTTPVSTVKFSQGGRIITTHVYFGRGAYPARASDVESLLNDLVITPQRILPKCESSAITISVDNQLKGAAEDLTVLHATNTGPTCHLAGHARLTVKQSSASLPIPNSETGAQGISTLIAHGNHQVIGWWYLYGWCGGAGPLTYNVSSTWGDASRVGGHIPAPCNATSASPRPVLRFTPASLRHSAS